MDSFVWRVGKDVCRVGFVMAHEVLGVGWVMKVYLKAVPLNSHNV